MGRRAEPALSVESCNQTSSREPNGKYPGILQAHRFDVCSSILAMVEYLHHGNLQKPQVRAFCPSFHTELVVKHLSSLHYTLLLSSAPFQPLANHLKDVSTLAIFCPTSSPIPPPPPSQ